jgi:hypothetical protein
VTIGSIDPEQRRVAQRLVLAALRKFHKEQPMSVDLRVDSLVTRVRSAAGRKPPPRHRGATPLTLDDADLRRVIDEMADDGRLSRNGRRVGLPDTRPTMDPETAERVDRLLDGLRAAGAEPPRVDGLAGRLGITPTVIDQLRAGGVLRQIAPGIDYPADVWSALLARVEGMGRSPSIGRVRDELHTSRRHAEAILAAVGAMPQAARPGSTRPSYRRPRPRG